MYFDLDNSLTARPLQEGNDRNGWKTLKTIPSHSGKARFYYECALEGEPVGFVKSPCGYGAGKIPSPYASSPTKSVYRWQGKPVIVVETKHKNFEVIEVPHNEPVYKTDDEASDAFMAELKAARENQ